MKIYRIENTKSGVDFGLWQGESPEEAIKKLNIDAGYPSGIVDPEISTEGIEAYEVTLVALGDIATLAGVKQDTVAKWIARHPDFPAPIAETSAGKIWQREDIVEWLKATGRI